MTTATSPSTVTNRVTRGGAWIYDARLTRIADRNELIPSYRLSYLGFRLARAL